MSPTCPAGWYSISIPHPTSPSARSSRLRSSCASASKRSVCKVFAKPPVAKACTWSSLVKPEISELVPVRILMEHRKWSGFGREVRISRRKRGDPVATLASLFSVKRGIATGANAFFLLPRSEAERLGISEEFLKPVLPSPRDLHETVIDADRRGYPRVVNPHAVIDTDMPSDQLRKACPGLWRYLKQGEEQGIPDLYLTAKRTPWYRQEQRPPAPFLCTYMRSEEH